MQEQQGQAMAILQLILSAIGGAWVASMPILLWLLRNRSKAKKAESGDQSQIKLKLIDAGENQRTDYERRLDKERERGDGWQTKYYDSQLELARVRESASQNNLRIVELDQRVKELEKQREGCRCKEDKE